MPLALLVSTPVQAQQRAVEAGVILRGGVGYELVSTDLSDEPALQGHTPDLRTSTQLLDVELALGTRGLGWQTFNTYALGQMVMDLEGSPAEDELLAHGTVYHAWGDARAFLLHLAYAELEGFTREGALARVHLRAGRQFHWGGGLTFTFDGATVGYDDGQLAAAARFGRRAAVYYENGQEDPGLVGGASVAYDFGRDVGLTLRGEYVVLLRELELTARDRMFVEDTETVDADVHYGDVGVWYDVTRELLLQGRVTFVAPEVSHVRAGLRWAFGRSTLLLDVDQKVGRDLFYDLAGGRGYERADRRSTYESLRLNIPDRQPYTDARLLFSIAATESLWLEPMLGGRTVWADEAERTAYDADRALWGLGAFAGLPLGPDQGLELDARYEGAFYARSDGDEGHFFDTAAGAERFSHGLSGGVRYARGRRIVGDRVLGGRTLTAGVSAFIESWTLENRFIDPLDENMLGARAEVDWAFTDYTTAGLSYEVARDSTVFARFVEPFHAVRVHLEARL